MLTEAQKDVIKWDLSRIRERADLVQEILAKENLALQADCLILSLQSIKVIAGEAIMSLERWKKRP